MRALLEGRHGGLDTALQLYDSVGIPRGDRVGSAQQTAKNFEGLGVGAVPQAALATFSPLVREHFGLPDTRKVVCAISSGWEDPQHAVNAFRTDRASTQSFVTWAG
ncbi:MAG: hypothetical protein ABR549_12715 [Mycobacteriales bacterium]